MNTREMPQDFEPTKETPFETVNRELGESMSSKDDKTSEYDPDCGCCSHKGGPDVKYRKIGSHEIGYYPKTDDKSIALIQSATAICTSINYVASGAVLDEGCRALKIEAHAFLLREFRRANRVAEEPVTIDGQLPDIKKWTKDFDYGSYVNAAADKRSEKCCDLPENITATIETIPNQCGATCSNCHGTGNEEFDTCYCSDCLGTGIYPPPYPVPCLACKGSGQRGIELGSTESCHLCKGSGIWAENLVGIDKGTYEKIVAKAGPASARMKKFVETLRQQVINRTEDGPIDQTKVIEYLQKFGMSKKEIVKQVLTPVDVSGELLVASGGNWTPDKPALSVDRLEQTGPVMRCPQCREGLEITAPATRIDDKGEYSLYTTTARCTTCAKLQPNGFTWKIWGSGIYRHGGPFFFDRKSAETALKDSIETRLEVGGVLTGDSLKFNLDLNLIVAKRCPRCGMKLVVRKITNSDKYMAECLHGVVLHEYILIGVGVRDDGGPFFFDESTAKDLRESGLLKEGTDLGAELEFASDKPTLKIDNSIQLDGSDASIDLTFGKPRMSGVIEKCKEIKAKLDARKEGKFDA